MSDNGAAGIITAAVMGPIFALSWVSVWTLALVMGCALLASSGALVVVALRPAP